MKIEHSGYSREGYQYAYAFTDWEMQQIGKALNFKPIINKLKLKIIKIRNNPKNEGQATYAARIEELEREIVTLNEISKTFTNHESKSNR